MARTRKGFELNAPNDDVDQWLAKLNGQSKEAVGAPMEAIRSAMQQADQNEAATQGQETERDLQRLRFALRREQLDNEKTRKKDGVSLANLAASPRRNLAMAAAVIMVFGSALLFNNPDQTPSGGDSPGDPAVMRGAKTEIIRAPDAISFAKTLEAQLKAAGAKVTVRGDSKQAWLEIVLRHPVDEKIRKVLADQAIPTPESGALKLQVLAQ